MNKQMHLITVLLVLLTPVLVFGQQEHQNPFFEEWTTPSGSPPFDTIHEDHYLPAYEEGIRQHMEEINAIISNPEPPDFENTIVAYDQAGALLRRITPVFGGLRSAETNPRLQAIARETTPMLTAHYNAIRLNEDLFERIRTVYDNRGNRGLDREQTILVEKIYQDFERGGAALPEDKREEFKKNSERMSMVSLQLNENLLAENNAFELVIEDETDLAGLPPNVIEAAAEEARRKGMEGKWVFTTAFPSRVPFLQFSENRDLRKQMFLGYVNRGDNDNENDNKELFIELMMLRQHMSEMLGYRNYAEYFTAIQMAENPQNVYDFLFEIWEPALARAEMEREEMQGIIDREGSGFNLEAWDWWYYAEKLRKEKYELDDDEVKPYFTIDNVKQGIFTLAHKLWGLTFEPRPEVPVYHEEVEAYEVFDYNGSHLAVLFIDPHPRPGKSSGAWCSTYRSGAYENGEWVTPIVTMVMNFTRPSGEKPAMLSWDETTTYFHEFGHAVHNFFAQGRYRRTTRSVPRDFVELPSQILENWAGEPELLQIYAKHYQTGEIIPEELVKRLQESEHFNQGFIQTEYLAAAILDMDWHTSKITADKDVNAFEEASMQRIGLIDEIVPRYRTTNFGHIFGGGYAAGYYVYRWAEVLDADAFQAFKDSGDLFNRKLARDFRKYILANNAIYEGMEAYIKFRGQEPDIEPFLRRNGLK
jgi:peptidyl-dipeptidase Dcp